LPLPEDAESLKALVLTMAAKAASAETELHDLKIAKASADERIARLTSILKKFLRERHGRKSEKLGSDAAEQRSFVFEEIETGIAAVQALVDKGRDPATKAKRDPRPRKGFAAHLERVEVVIEPEIPAEHQGKDKIKIGEDVSERLDVIPARFRVIVTRRPKYAFKDSDGVCQALAPNHIIEGGIPTEALLALIAVSKYADGQPLYRQEGIYARDGVEVDRSQMAQWMGIVGFEFEPLADHVLSRIKQGERIFADETTLPTLSPGNGQTKTAWLWAYARDDRPFGGDGPPMVAYRFEDSRSGECVATHLAGYNGLLQVDGYTAYQRLEKPNGRGNSIQLAGCWAHVRRKFHDLHANGESRLATVTVERMTALWALEADIRGKTPDDRSSARQQIAAPAIADLFALWDKELPKLSGKSKLAEAIRYAIARRTILERFLHDGRIEIDSNIVERAIRPQTITRKNSLFAGSDGGGRTWATIATMLTTAKMNDVDPFAWAKQTLERLANGWKQTDIEELMPWNYKP
jgi:transposase/predicted DNA-binding protein